MRAELKRLHLENQATTVYVTHDQVEAMSLADRIAIMNEGVLQQVGTPVEVYRNPANLFVAQFVGSPVMNVVEGRRHADGERAAGTASATATAASTSRTQPARGAQSQRRRRDSCSASGPKASA